MAKHRKTELATKAKQLYYEGVPIWKIAETLDVTEAYIVRLLGLN